MCLGIPGEVVALLDRGGLRFGTVRFAGILREVCLELLPDVAPGEFVLVHVGMAISKINREDAERAYRVLEELGETRDLSTGSDGGAP